MGLLTNKNLKKLQEYLSIVLPKYSDADAKILSDYIVALLSKDLASSEIKQSCTVELRDFLGAKTEDFVRALFKKIDGFDKKSKRDFSSKREGKRDGKTRKRRRQEESLSEKRKRQDERKSREKKSRRDSGSDSENQRKRKKQKKSKTDAPTNSGVTGDPLVDDAISQLIGVAKKAGIDYTDPAQLNQLLVTLAPQMGLANKQKDVLKNRVQRATKTYTSTEFGTARVTTLTQPSVPMSIRTRPTLPTQRRVPPPDNPFFQPDLAKPSGDRINRAPRAPMANGGRRRNFGPRRGGRGRGRGGRFGRPNNGPQRNVFVSNIPSYLNNVITLSKHFERFGDIENLQIHKDQNKAFVQFKTHDQAHKAVECDEPVLGEDKVSVQWAHYNRPDFERNQARPVAKPAKEQTNGKPEPARTAPTRAQPAGLPPRPVPARATIRSLLPRKKQPTFSEQLKKLRGQIQMQMGYLEKVEKMKNPDKAFKKKLVGNIKALMAKVKALQEKLKGIHNIKAKAAAKKKSKPVAAKEDAALADGSEGKEANDDKASVAATEASDKTSNKDDGPILSYSGRGGRGRGRGRSRGRRGYGSSYRRRGRGRGRGGGKSRDMVWTPSQEVNKVWTPASTESNIPKSPSKNKKLDLRSRVLDVTEVPDTLNEPELRAHFQTMGQVESISMIDVGHARIKFNERTGAEKAKNDGSIFKNHNLQDHKLNISFYTPSETTHDEPVADTTAAGGEFEFGAED